MNLKRLCLSLFKDEIDRVLLGDWVAAEPEDFIVLATVQEVIGPNGVDVGL